MKSAAKQSKEGTNVRSAKQAQLALQFFEILLGNLLYALAVTLFILPNNLMTGGTTGLALFFYHTAGIPVSFFISAFNLIMFCIGAWILGRKFALSTVLSSIFYPLILRALELGGVHGFVLEERLVAVLYAGLLIGAGIGIVMRAGASTGGMDIPALILKKKAGLSISGTLYFCDCIILLLQAFLSDPTSILYGILVIIVYTLVLDRILLIGSAKIEVKIISSKTAELNRLLGERIDCGTSLLHMQTGYLHKEQDMILAVISKQDLSRLNRLVLELDPEAFMIISQTNEVRGRGFTLNKVYYKNVPVREQS